MRYSLLSVTLATLAITASINAQVNAPVTAQDTTSTAPASSSTTTSTSTSTAVQLDPSYNAGLKALDEARWADAVTDFDKSAAAAPTAGASALYWKAYSLEKLGRNAEANSTCDQLRSKHRDSSWNRECSMLRAQVGLDNLKLKHLPANGSMSTTSDLNLMIDTEIHDNVGKPFSDANTRYYIYDGSSGKNWKQTPEEDIKIIALNGLMQQDPEKALPLLRDIIQSDKPVEVRKQALFVLSRSKRPEAQAYLLDIAKSGKDPIIQREAIQSLWMSRGKEASPTLVQIYRASADAKVKQAAINGLFLAHDAPSLVDLARGEKDLNLKRDIVAQLALMKDPAATDYMLELLK